MTLPDTIFISRVLAERKGVLTEALRVAVREDDRRIHLNKADFLRLMYPEQKAVVPVETSKEEVLRNLPSKLARMREAARSMAKTKLLRKDRVSPEQLKARLDVCAACPGGHVVMKNGKPFSCGPLLGDKPQTCGCALSQKASDIKQDCPNGYWPEIEA